jgi:hypothetical protein
MKEYDRAVAVVDEALRPSISDHDRAPCGLNGRS